MSRWINPDDWDWDNAVVYANVDRGGAEGAMRTRMWFSGFLSGAAALLILVLGGGALWSHNADGAAASVFGTFLLAVCAVALGAKE